MHTSGVETEGVVGEVRLPVVLLLSVVRKRMGEEIFRHRRRPTGEFQRVEAPPDVVEYLLDDGAWVMNPTTRIRSPHRHGSKAGTVATSGGNPE